MARLSTGERRAQLLGIGREAFSQGAFDAVHLADVAREAGVSKGLLYHYFGDKRGYYQAVLAQVAVDLLEVTTFPSTLDTEAAIAHAVDGFITYTVANEPFYRALIRGGIGSDAAVDAQVEQVRRTLVDRIRSRLQLPRDPLTERVLYGWIGFAEFSTLDWLGSGRDRSAHAMLLTRSLLALLESR
jgi:AcrR family transcriptional regulator